MAVAYTADEQAHMVRVAEQARWDASCDWWNSAESDPTVLRGRGECELADMVECEMGWWGGEEWVGAGHSVPLSEQEMQ
jgi:hypothetical protein